MQGLAAMYAHAFGADPQQALADIISSIGDHVEQAFPEATDGHSPSATVPNDGKVH
jgi:hypothetical protein